MASKTNSSVLTLQLRINELSLIELIKSTPKLSRRPTSSPFAVNPENPPTIFSPFTVKFGICTSLFAICVPTTFPANPPTKSVFAGLFSSFNSGFGLIVKLSLLIISQLLIVGL